MDYVCTVGTAEGAVVEETLNARSEDAARRELERRGYHVFKVRPRGVAWSFSWPGNRKQRQISQRGLMIFNQELASLLKAGLPMLQAIELMHERQHDAVFKEVLGEVRMQVRNGKDLSEAVEALVYPAVLIGLSAALIAVMTIYVVPKFSEFFNELSADLPLITRLTLGLSTFMSRHWPVVLLATVGAGIAVRQWSRTEWGSLTLSRWRLRLPLLGPVFRRLAVSEFCRSLSTLLSGGIPAVPALENAVGAVGNSFVRKRMEPMIARIREGAALHVTLEESGVSPEIAIEMAKVGEETGSLDVMMGNASDFLDEEVDTRMERILTLVEPIMLILMGLIVATLLVSVYLPLFSMLGEVRD
jgi:type IV pilus assembly protein PilC